MKSYQTFITLLIFRASLFFCRFALLLGIGLLSACTGNQGAAWETIKLVFQSPSAQLDQQATQPQFLYLRAQINDASAQLVLGYRQASDQGEIDTWYSGQRELIQLQNGRLIGSQGLDINWSDVRLINPPDLTNPEEVNFNRLQQKKSPLRFRRERLVMPGYQQIQEQVTLERLASAPSDAPKALRNDSGIFWVRESAIPAGAGKANPASNALEATYAIRAIGDRQTVVYGKQCLAQDLCLSWQVWPTPLAIKRP